MGKRIGIGVLLLAIGAGAQDRKAARYAKQAAKLADAATAEWKRFVLERDQLDDDALRDLAEQYDKAIDLYEKSLEVEEQPALHGTMLLLTRRLTKVRFELHYREQKRKRATAPAKRPEPKPKPRPEGAEPEPAEPEPRRATEPEPMPEETTQTDARYPPVPDLIESKKESRRAQQALRNFVIHHYFASRKLSSLVDRCNLCNGTGKRPTNRLDERRRIITMPCTTCGETGFHLEVPQARKTFWLSHTPLYRSNPDKRAEFESQLAAWRADPRTVPEYLKSVRIKETDYHGLWATVRLQEKGTAHDGGRFERTVDRVCVRIGKRWYFYDPKIDRDLFTLKEGE